MVFMKRFKGERSASKRRGALTAELIPYLAIGVALIAVAGSAVAVVYSNYRESRIVADVVLTISVIRSKYITKATQYGKIASTIGDLEGSLPGSVVPTSVDPDAVGAKGTLRIENGDIEVGPYPARTASNLDARASGFYLGVTAAAEEALGGEDVCIQLTDALGEGSAASGGLQGYALAFTTGTAPTAVVEMLGSACTDAPPDGYAIIFR